METQSDNYKNNEELSANNIIKTTAKRKIELGFFERISDWISKASKCNFTSIKRHFNVTEDLILKRVLYSFIPFNPYFYELIKNKPDLYGPLWIYTSLVFIIAATGEISSYLNGNESSGYFEEFVPHSALMIYGIGIGLPLLIFFLMRVFGSDPSYVTIQCIYGYSFFAYIPASLICMIPNKTIHVFVFGVAVFISTSLLMVNCWKDFSIYIKSRTYFLVGLIVICQLIIYLVMVLYFFGLEDKLTDLKKSIGGGLNNNVSNNTSSNSSNTTFKNGSY